MGSANTLSRPSYKSVRTTTMDNSKSNIDLTQILVALQHLQQENAMFRDSVTHLQNQPPPPAPVPPALAMVALEPQISLPEKFDGTHLKFRGFVSQVRLIMQLHPRRYFDDTTCRICWNPTHWDSCSMVCSHPGDIIPSPTRFQRLYGRI